MNLYDKGEYPGAKKLFIKLSKEYGVDSEKGISSRVYIARCWNKAGDKDRALKELESLMEDIREKDIMPRLELLDELVAVGGEKASVMIRPMLRDSPYGEIRKKAAELMASMPRPDPSVLKENMDIMLEALRMEPELDVARGISVSINKMGKVSIDKLRDMYGRADSFLKQKLLYLIAEYNEEELIMVLQDESERAPKVISGYISWALGKMDPYRFASSMKGKLKKEGDAYILYMGTEKVELFGPALQREKNDELESYVGKDIVVYGIEKEEGVIYTDIFRQSRR
ncbi:MAG: hypothetical protein JXJ19_03840 [Elusimicrobia bacterium]|nr:hypothetical protein [Elusimicrobiota bacterium]